MKPLPEEDFARLVARIRELEQRGIALCFAPLKQRQGEISQDAGLAARIGLDRALAGIRTAVAALECFEWFHAGEAGKT